MMNPYAARFAHPTDQIIAWVLAVILLSSGTFVFYRMAPLGTKRGERLCIAFGYSFLGVCGCVAANLVMGWTLLVKLGLASPIWSFWGLGYLIGVIVVFRVLPVFALGLAIWALIGKRAAAYSSRALWTAAACALFLIVAAALYFGLDNATR